MFSHIIIATFVTQGLGLLSSFLCRPFSTALSEIIISPLRLSNGSSLLSGSAYPFLVFHPPLLGPVPTTDQSIRVHTTVLMRFRLSTLKRSKAIELHVVT